MEMKRAKLRGAMLIVADPRETWIARHADIYLQLRPGTDVWLLNAMAYVIIEEGLLDQAYIDEHTENFDAVVAATRDSTPENAAKITGLKADMIRAAARAYATTIKAGIYYTLGITEHTHGTDNVYGLANLVLMTGHLGKPSAGLNPLRGQNNVQGANDAGASPIFLPGYQRVSDPVARQRFEAAWGRPVDPNPGLNLNEMMHTLGDGIRGMYIMGEDPLLSEPNANVVEQKMKGVDFIIVQDIFMTATAEQADVILPATCFAEKDGVFTNSDRCVQRVRKAVEPPGEARADWRIICDIARGVGYPMPEYSHPSEIYDEFVGLTDQFAGISHARIDAEGGIHWPCPTSDHPGTPILHVDGPVRGKAVFQPITFRPSAETPDPEYPMSLSTGRTLYHYNAATQTRIAEGADAKQPDCFLQIHPRDANRQKILEGTLLRITSRRGEVLASARITREVQPGCVWMPMHFAEAMANRLTNDAGDSVTGTGEYKVCAVDVEIA
jgi:formate dehydrogenase major subunit/formate dehydrogenase alpha subunit